MRILNYYLGQIRLMSAANHAPECLEPAPLPSPPLGVCCCYQLAVPLAEATETSLWYYMKLARQDAQNCSSLCSLHSSFVEINLRTPTTKRRLGDPDDSYLARCRQRVYKLRRLRLCSCVLFEYCPDNHVSAHDNSCMAASTGDAQAPCIIYTTF